MHSQFFKAIFDVIAEGCLLSLCVGNIGYFHALPDNLDHNIEGAFSENWQATVQMARGINYAIWQRSTAAPPST